MVEIKNAERKLCVLLCGRPDMFADLHCDKVTVVVTRIEGFEWVANLGSELLSVIIPDDDRHCRRGEVQQDFGRPVSELERHHDGADGECTVYTGVVEGDFGSAADKSRRGDARESELLHHATGLAVEMFRHVSSP